MASEAEREKLRRDVVCSLCLDLFTRPVALDCKHNFCTACIMKSWKKLEENFPCPTCGQLFPYRTFTTNWELIDMVERARHLNVYEKYPANVCREHKKEVKSFCEKDGRLLCPVCEQSDSHKRHSILPIEAAAKDHKDFLKNSLESLRENLQDNLTFKAEVETKIPQLMNRKEAWRQRIKQEFEHLHRFLEEEKEILLAELDEELQSQIRDTERYISSLEDRVTSIQHRIQEIEVKLQQQDTMLLKDIKRSNQRYGAKYDVSSNRFIRDCRGRFCGPSQYFLWKKMIKSISPAPSPLTLDPDTASPQLIISETRKCAFFTESRQDILDNPNRFDDHPCVLGSEGFLTGRHYWEVKFSCFCIWNVGVAKESAIRKGPVTFTPDEGYWVFRFFEFYKPLKIGVFLDCEEGQLSLYDVEKQSHLMTINGCFTEKLFPFFYLRQAREPCHLQL